VNEDAVRRIVRALGGLAVALAVLACGDDGGDDGHTADAGADAGPDAPILGCGNGVPESGEACDDGAGNSDVRADACRRDCSAPRCGDRVVDGDEVDGCFAAPAPLATDATSFLAADLDGDGLPDLALAGPSGVARARLSAGGAGAPVEVALPFPAPDDFFVADLDGDGRAELVATDEDGIAVVRFTVGGMPQLVDELAWAGGRLSAGDTDGDGAAELAWSEGGTGFFVTRLAGGALAAPALVAAPAGAIIDHVALADATGDGLADAVVALHDAVDARVGVMPADAGGGGAFGAFASLASEAQPVRELGAADVDGDGIADAAFLVGGGRLELRAGPPGASGSATVDVALMDTFRLVELDGWPGAEVVTVEGSALRVRSGLFAGGGGVVGPAVDVGAWWSLALADADGDGVADLLVADEVGGLARHAGGDGPLGRPEPVGAAVAATGVAAGPCVGGAPDDVAVATTSGLALYAGREGGGLAAPATTLIGGTSLRGVAMGDVDGDGVCDLVAHTAADTWTVLGGDGQGGFAPRGSGAAAGAVVVRAADVDGDGRDDLVGCGDGLTLWRGQAAGGLGAAEAVVGALPGGASCADLVVRDLDGDGDADVAAATGPGGVAVYENGGGAALVARGVVAGVAAAVGFGDVDDDGVVDLVRVGADEVVVHRGLGALAYASGGGAGVAAPGVSVVLVEDLNGDGAADVVAGGGVGGALYTLYADGAGGLEAAAVAGGVPAVQGLAMMTAAGTRRGVVVAGAWLAVARVRR
jgi:hypothetical protein